MYRCGNVLKGCYCLLPCILQPPELSIKVVQMLMATIMYTIGSFGRGGRMSLTWLVAVFFWRILYDPNIWDMFYYCLVGSS